MKITFIIFSLLLVGCHSTCVKIGKVAKVNTCVGGAEGFFSSQPPSCRITVDNNRNETISALVAIGDDICALTSPLGEPNPSICLCSKLNSCKDIK